MFRAQAARAAVPSAGLTALPAGTRIGQFQIVSVLGQGTFGITYRAVDAQLDREVAIKEYLPTSFAMRQPDLTVLPHSTQLAEDFRWGRERFLAEARTLARLERAVGIVNVHAFLEANGTAYMVMALVRGETLEARLKREGRLSPQAVEQLLPPLLDGLEKVHAASFLHRDIKPANILIDEDGQPTLIDFGASRVALQGRTQTMTAVYTPGYAAFEQFTSGKQGPWTDIYGLGATLYHCIAGAQPPSAVERTRDDAMVPAVEAGRGRYAPGLLAVIDAALRLREADRPQTVGEWRRMMAAAAASAQAAPRGPAKWRSDAVTGADTSSRRLARARWPIWLAAAVVILGLAGGGYYLWRRAEDTAVQLAAERKARGDAAAKQRADEAAARLAREKAQAEAEAKRRAEEAAARQAAEEKARADADARRRAEEARARLGSRDCELCPEMVRIPTGAFLMGSLSSDPDHLSDESPQHRVTIGYTFSLGKYEVTRGEFAAFVRATGYQAGRDWSAPSFSQTDRDPVVSVNWNDAQAYVDWLKRATGKNYRLPSEAEWEYAARAGTVTSRYWDAPGRQACAYVNVDDSPSGCTDGFRNTAPVGRFQPNAFGLYDMLGNVWEWTADCWNSRYTGAPTDGSAWLAGDCSRRMLRGGSWSNPPPVARAAFRQGATATSRYSSSGFRVARSD